MLFTMQKTFMRKMKLMIFLYLINGISSLNTSLKFGVIADWGGIPVFPYKTFVELSVGKELDAFARNFGLDAILALGDNFYFNGVKDVYDPRFKETFETAFNYDSLNIPWLVIAGNHDHYGNVSAQIAYSALSERWHFPELYYKKKLAIPFCNITVDIVMIDTIVLCGNTDPKNPLQQPISNSSYTHIRKKQWIWLEDTLRNSKANYLLVCGHYPVYSIATHGPTDCLVNNLRPLLYKYDVSAYLSGHDHNIQHIQVKDKGKVMDYIITGSANTIDPSKKNFNKIPPNSLKFHWGNIFSLGAFTYIDINKLNMTVSFSLSSGKKLYSFYKQPRWN